MYIKLNDNESDTVGILQFLLNKNWKVKFNNEIDTKELARIKKYCEEFLSFPLIQALNSEDI